MLVSVTTLISRSGYESEIAVDFLKAFKTKVDTHHLEALLIQQEGGLSFLVSLFRNRSDFLDWQKSRDRQRLVNALDAHSLREHGVLQAPFARIVVPSNESGPKWKDFVSSWIATTPVLLGVVRALDWLAPGISWGIRLAIISAAMSVTIIWIISPSLQRATRIWRLKKQQMQIAVVGADQQVDDTGVHQTLRSRNARSLIGGPAATR